MHVGTVAAGRIGLAVLRRLKPFDMHLHYTDRHRLPPEVEQELGVTFHADARSTWSRIATSSRSTRRSTPRPRTCSTTALIAQMKRGAYLVNTARGKIANRDAVAERSKAAISRATPATSGSRSRRRATIRGGPCPITA